MILRLSRERVVIKLSKVCNIFDANETLKGPSSKGAATMIQFHFTERSVS